MKGNYRDLGLPDSWLELSETLKEQEEDGVHVVAPDLSDEIRSLLVDLPDRTQFILAMRAIAGESLGSIGETLSLTRERVRQLESKATDIFLRHDSLRKRVDDWIDDQNLGGYAIVRFDHGTIELGEYGPIEWESAWRMLFHLAKSAGLPWTTKRLADECWLLGNRSGDDTLEVEPHLRSKARFIHSEELARAIGLRSTFIRRYARYIPGVMHTNGGHLISRHLSNKEYAVACAKVLVEHGFEHWHFSELGALLRLVFPKRFENLGARDFAALLGRPGTPFVPAGPSGHWTIDPDEPRGMQPSEAPRTSVMEGRMIRIEPPAQRAGPGPATQPYLVGPVGYARWQQPGPTLAKSQAVATNAVGTVDERVLGWLTETGEVFTVDQIATAIGEAPNAIRRVLIRYLEPTGQVASLDGRRWRASNHMITKRRESLG